MVCGSLPMTKVAITTIPPAFQAMLDKTLAHFDNQIYPTWATRFLHTTRSAKRADREKTYIPGAKTIWNAFTGPEKLAWNNAKYGVYRSGYNVFLGDYSYRQKYGLTIPGTPDITHQIYGLQMSNFGGLEYVTLERHDIVVEGPISVHFSYKKIERDVPALWPFALHVDAYYFKGGENLIDSYDWVFPDGNIDWTEVSFSFGVTSRYYFHVVCTFTLWLYDADVFFDNFLVSDNVGDINREAWKLNVKKEWVYTPKVRKQGWLFEPEYVEPWFKVVYLDS